MTKNQIEIKEYIYEKNQIEEKEKKIYEKFINFFINQEVLNIKEWDLNIYKKYILFDKKKLINQKNTLENLNESAELFIKYIKRNKNIYIITDNDLDGTAANAIAKAVKIFLERKFNKKNIYNIQFAYGTNHGLSFTQIENLIKNKNEEVLIITADNGINNKEEIKKIKNNYKNAKIIITDHHTANEEENVFDLVEYVINPEAIAINKKSQITNLEIDNKIYQTSISGAHTFYLLILKVLEKLKIRNELLQEELKLIALFSDVGDIINYHLDIQNDIVLNYPNFKDKMYIFQHYIENLNYFTQVPNKNHIDKMRDYFKESITIFNSVRRLNSLLMSINNFKNEEDITKWFKENFNLNAEEIFINQENIKDFIIKTNERAKVILEYFNEPLEEKYNFYSYIKNIVPYALLSKNQLKTDKDKVYINEIMEIINDLNQLKKILRNHIVEKQLYKTYKKENIEIYISGIGSILREILSIQVFIEAKKNIPYINLAKNYKDNEIKGSLRSPKFFPLKKLLLENKKINEIKKKYDLNIKILGHTEAAGINFTIKNKNIQEEDIYKFFDEINEEINLEMKKVEKDIPEESIEVNIEDLSKVNVNKFQKVFNDYLYKGVHPFFKIPKIKIKLEEIENLFQEKLKMSISKKGNKYLTKKKNNLTIMYFGEEEKLKNKNNIFEGNFSFKFNPNNKSFYIELILN